jgi:hypothetical protein
MNLKVTSSLIFDFSEFNLHQAYFRHCILGLNLNLSRLNKSWLEILLKSIFQLFYNLFQIEKIYSLQFEFCRLQTPPRIC